MAASGQAVLFQIRCQEIGGISEKKKKKKRKKKKKGGRLRCPSHVTNTGLSKSILNGACYAAAKVRQPCVGPIFFFSF
jgi:hypothetical protein